MARIKYHYNPETCRYEPISTTKSEIFLNIGLFVVAAIIAGVGLAWIFGRYYKSEQELALRDENQELLEHYNLLNKELEEVNKILAALQQRDDNIYRVIFAAEPVPSSIRNAGSGGTNKYRDLMKKGLKKEKLILETAQKVDRLKRQMYVQSKSYDDIVKMVKDKEKMLSHTPAIQPISNKQLTRLTSGFGMRIHPIYKVGQFHPGIDFAAPPGTPIYATADGVIEKSLYEGGYGNYVVISHGYGYKTLYAHMQNYIVKPGQKVKRGECIGYVGSTGFSTAPHVHYEVMLNGEQVNPVYYFFKDLSSEEYEKVLNLASKENQSLS